MQYSNDNIGSPVDGRHLPGCWFLIAACAVRRFSRLPTSKHVQLDRSERPGRISRSGEHGGESGCQLGSEAFVEDGPGGGGNDASACP